MVYSAGMKTDTPRVVVLAGINGAGKTTASREILSRVLRIPTFVNADVIARGLNGLNPEGEAIRVAGSCWTS
jgi:predicted ABC-type ATPase